MSDTFRYTIPVPARSATGKVAAIYAQQARDFSGRPIPLFMSMSPAPDLLAAVWSLLRESLLVGDANMVDKEIVAVGVSLANRCPFCVDAHTMLLHANGAHRVAETILAGGVPEDPHQARLLAWAKATRTPDAPELTEWPFPATQAAQFIGTALAFHVINRMVSSILTDNLFPGNAQRFRLVRNLSGRIFARTVSRRSGPGDSLALLSDSPTGKIPAWAAGTPTGTALVALRAVARTGGDLLTATSRDLLARTMDDFGGEHPPLSSDWLTETLWHVTARERPAAKLALLAALAPYRITDRDVESWRAQGHDQVELLYLLAYGVMAATDRVEAAILGANANPSSLPTSPVEHNG